MNANSPYDASPAADVILRSCDNVHFYVLGSLLRFVSPFFMDIFMINQGPAVDDNEKKDGRPVIPLEEDSATLHLLLDLLYPCVKEPLLIDVTLFWRVAKAAQKYFIDIVEAKLQDRIVSSNLLSEVPLRLYAIAIDLGWDGLAIQAARKTLGTPLEQLVYVDELRSIPGSGFYRFLEYRLRCDKSSSKLTEELMVLPKKAAQGTNTENSNATALSNTDADPPFLSSQSTPKADLVLRSSDSIDFYVVEALIRLVSGDFDRVFPLEGRETKDGRTIIQVTENGKTLRQLLNIIYYYVDELDVHDYQLYNDVVEAARKYKMSVIEKKLRKQLLASPLIQDEPLRIYILALNLCWEEVIKTAALNTLHKPFREMGYIEELNRITGKDLFRLMSFRFRCSDAAWKALQADSTIAQYGPGKWSGFWYQNNPCRYQSDYYDDGYYVNRIPIPIPNPYKPLSSDECNGRIKDCPRGATVTKIYAAELVNLESAINSLAFSGSASTVCCILKSWNSSGNIVEEAVSKVSLDTP